MNNEELQNLQVSISTYKNTIKEALDKAFPKTTTFGGGVSNDWTHRLVNNFVNSRKKFDPKKASFDTVLAAVEGFVTGALVEQMYNFANSPQICFDESESFDVGNLQDLYPCMSDNTHDNFHKKLITSDPYSAIMIIGLFVSLLAITLVRDQVHNRLLSESAAAEFLVNKIREIPNARIGDFLSIIKNPGEKNSDEILRSVKVSRPNISNNFVPNIAWSTSFIAFSSFDESTKYLLMGITKSVSEFFLKKSARMISDHTRGETPIFSDNFLNSISEHDKIELISLVQSVLEKNKGYSEVSKVMVVNFIDATLYMGIVDNSFSRSFFTKEGLMGVVSNGFKYMAATLGSEGISGSAGLAMYNLQYLLTPKYVSASGIPASSVAVRPASSMVVQLEEIAYSTSLQTKTFKSPQK